MRHADGHRPVGTLHTPPRSNLAPSQQLNNLKNKKSSFLASRRANWLAEATERPRNGVSTVARTDCVRTALIAQ